MSAYRNFVVDFPNRCLELLDHYEADAATQEREVTFLLLVATSAFVVPFERLKDGHPSKDSLQLEGASVRLKKLLGTPCAKSEFIPKHGKNWLHGLIATFGDGPDTWPPSNVSVEEEPVDYVLSTIRNALAHGNLYTHGEPIRSLVFYSEKHEGFGPDSVMVGYKHLTVPVMELGEFLLSWLRLLRTLGPSYGAALDEIAKAA